MLETIAIILLVLWVLGLVSSYTVGGFIHILLVAAIIIFLIRILQGRPPRLGLPSRSGQVQVSPARTAEGRPFIRSEVPSAPPTPTTLPCRSAPSGTPAGT
jgi:hypothetical protein